MKRRIEKFLRTFVIPLGATVFAILFWLQYQCQSAWWWLVFVGLVFIGYYFLYFRKRNKYYPKRESL